MQNLNFFRANQRKANYKIYSSAQCNLTTNRCDWHILPGNDERIVKHSKRQFFNVK